MPSEPPADDEEMVEITYATARVSDDPHKQESVTKEVLKAWYEEFTHADEVFEWVREDWIQIAGIRSVGLSVRNYDGDDETTIVVAVDSTNADAETQIPDSVDGVPIEIKYSDPADDQLL